MSALTDLAADIDALAGHFAALHPDLADPAHAFERCAEMSEEFVAFLAEHNIPATVLTGIRYGEIEQFPGVRLMLGGHYAVLIADEEADVVYDWTARQFDPACPFPLVQRLAQWRETWGVFEGTTQ